MLGNHLIHYIMIKEEVDTDDDDNDDDDDDDGDEVTCKKVERHESDLGNMLIAWRLHKMFFGKINQEEKSRIRRQKKGASSVDILEVGLFVKVRGS